MSEVAQKNTAPCPECGTEVVEGRDCSSPHCEALRQESHDETERSLRRTERVKQAVDLAVEEAHRAFCNRMERMVYQGLATKEQVREILQEKYPGDMLDAWDEWMEEYES